QVDGTSGGIDGGGTPAVNVVVGRLADIGENQLEQVRLESQFECGIEAGGFQGGEQRRHAGRLVAIGEAIGIATGPGRNQDYSMNRAIGAGGGWDGGVLPGQRGSEGA